MKNKKRKRLTRQERRECDEAMMRDIRTHLDKMKELNFLEEEEEEEEEEVKSDE